MAIDSFLSGLPVLGSMFDTSEEDAMAQLQNVINTYGSIKTPEYKQYRPEEIQYAGDFNPELADAAQISEDPLIRSAQLSSINRMRDLEERGLSDVDAEGFLSSRRLGDQIARQGNAAAMQNAQARGISGSGLEFAMREQANQDAAVRAEAAAAAQAAESARNRANYAQLAQQGLSNIRAQDFGVNQANTNALNQFKQMNTGALNQAKLGNLTRKENIGAQNVGNRNQAQLQNNEYLTQNFQNQMARAAGLTGGYQGMAQGYGAQNAARAAERGRNTQIAMSAFGMPSMPTTGKKKLKDEE